MAFIYPSFLWALAGLAIPVIIHLFFFKRFKKVYFTNTRLLKEIKEETSSRNKLKNLLVLLMRCLAIASLVFAFAQPFIPKSDQVNLGEKSISIFIDNSYSMLGENQNVPLLELAKQRAREIINAYGPNDKFQILTHEFDGKYQRIISKDDALATVDAIREVPFVNDLSAVLQRQNAVLKGETRVSYLISDFQKSISNLADWKDSLLAVNLIPVQSDFQKNVSIDSVWFETPVPILNQNNKLLVRLVNHGDTEAEGIKISFDMDGQEKPVGVKSIPANSEVTDSINVALMSSGIKKAKVTILDYPIQFDDEYYITFEIPENIKILSLNENSTNPYLRALFNGISYFTLEDQFVNQVQYQKFNEYQLIILNDLAQISSGMGSELGKYIRNGGKVLVFPGQNADLNSFNAFTSANNAGQYQTKNESVNEVSSVNTNEFIFSDVFELNKSNLKLPVVQFYYSMGNAATAEPILTFRNGVSFINKYKLESGQLYLCASPLNEEKNNLVKNAEIFVPMLYKMAIARNFPDKISYKIGQDKVIELENNNQPTAETIFKIKGETEFIPGQKNLGRKILLDVGNQIAKAGYYEAILDDKVVKNLAFNLNRKESDLTINTPSELNDMTKSNPVFNIIDKEAQNGLTKTINQRDAGIPLWRYFIVAALLFLLFEILLIRFMK